MSHHCEHCVVTCIDFRFQQFINKFTSSLEPAQHDRISIAGAIKDLEFLMDQVKISKKLHGVSEIHLMIHEDCGVYTSLGVEKQMEDLRVAVDEITAQYPDLVIKAYKMMLDGEIQDLNSA